MNKQFLQSFKDRLHVMVDLETLGTSPNSVILSLGAVFVNFEGAEFYKNFSIGSQDPRFFSLSMKTLQWWREQNKEVMLEAFNGKIHLQDGLSLFKEWFPADAIIWGNGADFDIAILKYAYEHFGLDTPWSYKNTACLRTIRNMVDMKRVYEAVAEQTKDEPLQAHQALHDAKHQALQLREIFNLLLEE
jgi:exodeoxyribonuclease VIII